MKGLWLLNKFFRDNEDNEDNEDIELLLRWFMNWDKTLVNRKTFKNDKLE